MIRFNIKETFHLLIHHPQIIPIGDIFRIEPIAQEY